ncbi:hypothetical protein GR200_20720 [Rhizobium leguminosarum]|uniref:hypothetical protein n=1 Tax=Rhizobium leguminosarum TaxID=384 RepID=UPI0013BA9673|nr:hypothetical protein [Rhizobium leguminosarum]NEI57466.1 hypothetical protein [Rhizobium leguminosarum]NEI86326.1 hypothetical protein [Rhizobium leguminosarum]
MDRRKKHDAAAALRKQVANRHAVEAEQAVGVHILAERKRCAGLMALSAQAARIGVSFDADAAIRSRISLQAARNKVMAIAADGDAPETSPLFMPNAAGQNHQAGSEKAVDKAAMWRKAYESNRPKLAKLP